MEIRPYQSGRVGQPASEDAVLGSLTAFRSSAPEQAQTLALHARVKQEDAFCADSSGSLRYMLILNGVLPNLHEMVRAGAAHEYIEATIPEASPGANGSITVLLVL